MLVFCRWLFTSLDIFHTLCLNVIEEFHLPNNAPNIIIGSAMHNAIIAQPNSTINLKIFTSKPSSGSIRVEFSSIELRSSNQR